MIKREFRIENFRTLGISKPFELELGAISAPNKSFGGILLLVGQNNAGKSNIISALRSFSEKNVGLENKPRHLTDNSIEPKVRFVVKDENMSFFVKASKGKYEVEVSPETEKVIFDNKQKIEEKLQLTNENSKNALVKMLEFGQNFSGQTASKMLSSWGARKGNPNITLGQFGISSSFNDYFDKLLVFLAFVNQEDGFQNLNPKDYMHEFLKPIAEILKNIPMQSMFKFAQLVFEIQSDHLQSLYNDLVKSQPSLPSKEDRIVNYFRENYKQDLVPSIVFYDDKDGFNSNHLITNVVQGKIQNPIFFSKMFNLLENTNYDKVSAAYDAFFAGGEKNKGQLFSIKRVLEKDLQILSDQFNKIYTGKSKGQYSFVVDFESKRIDFIILENGEPVYYDDQSSGFKWFFNFFFNVTANKSTKPGSIILMDEPATNLHVVGQVELRKLIKRYGIENNILFIISTHSPFFVDVDHLDELRVIRKVERESMVDNKFTHLNGNDIDTLLPVYSALTVGKHILLNPGSTIIFVEGISDYNYLCAFKSILAIDDINFLPIQGVGKDDQQEVIFKKLLKITPNPIVLVDGDYAGKSFKNNNSYKSIEIITLKEVDDSFRTIETVFDKKDSTENPLIANKIEPYYSSIEFKNEAEINKKTLSKKTIANFEAVFKRLGH